MRTIALVAILGAACSETPTKNADPNADPNANTGGDTGADADPNNSSAGDMSSEPDTAAAVTCDDLAYAASGTACGTCSLSCDCEEGFPVSVAICTTDGCIVSADCPSLCAMGLPDALDCDDTYTIQGG